MDNLTIMLAVFLSSLQQIPHQLPARPPPVAAQAVKKPQAPPSTLKAIEYACPSLGRIDAHGKLNDCFNKN